MKVASVADVKSKLSAYQRTSREGPVVVTRNGKAVAVLLAIEDDDELERLVMAYTPRLRAIVDAARGRIGRGMGIPHDKFWRDLEGERPPTKHSGRRARPREKKA
jgi:prevent-host-death family protein